MGLIASALVPTTLILFAYKVRDLINSEISKVLSLYITPKLGTYWFSSL
jgi:hypothetical protein